MQPRAVLQHGDIDANECEESPNAAHDDHTYRRTVEKSYINQRLERGGVCGLPRTVRHFFLCVRHRFAKDQEEVKCRYNAPGYGEQFRR